jgi:hypothetical protein
MPIWVGFHIDNDGLVDFRTDAVFEGETAVVCCPEGYTLPSGNPWRCYPEITIVPTSVKHCTTRSTSLLTWWDERALDITYYTAIDIFAFPLELSFQNNLGPPAPSTAGSSTGTDAPSGNPGSSLPLATKIGIGVAVPIVALLLAGALLLWARRRRRRLAASKDRDQDARNDFKAGHAPIEEYTKPELDAAETEIFKHEHPQKGPDPVELDGNINQSVNARTVAFSALDPTSDTGEVPTDTGNAPPAETVSPATPVALIRQPVQIEPVKESAPQPCEPPAKPPSEPPSKPPSEPHVRLPSTSTPDMESLDKLSALLERKAKIAEEQEELERMRRLREEAAAVDEEIQRLKELSKSQVKSE